MLQLGYQAGRHTRERIEKLAEDMDKMLFLAASKDASVLTLGELLEVDA